MAPCRFAKLATMPFEAPNPIGPAWVQPSTWFAFQVWEPYKGAPILGVEIREDKLVERIGKTLEEGLRTKTFIAYMAVWPLSITLKPVDVERGIVLAPIMSWTAPTISMPASPVAALRRLGVQDILIDFNDLSARSLDEMRILAKRAAKGKKYAADPD